MAAAMTVIAVTATLISSENQTASTIEIGLNRRKNWGCHTALL
jgi:hypothetical protein